jgi:hypothetical protein
MRLSEITLPGHRYDAEQRLKNAGYELLGHEGSYGSVYQKPGAAYVLKLFANDDDAFRAFVTLARQNPNPHFPRYIGKMTHVGGEGGYAAIRMERLSECTDLALITHIVRYIDGRDRNRDQFPFYRWQEVDAALVWMNDRPDLKAACDLLIAHVGGFRFDLKIDNLMMRGAIPVFIDPYANRPKHYHQ